MSFDASDDVRIKLDIYVNGAWLEVTSRSRSAGGVRLTISRTPGATQAESARMECVIGNDDGWLTEGNPFSPWWPYVRRGCPIRLALRGFGTGRRFIGQINTLVNEYVSPGICNVKVTALGTLGMKGQGSPPADSAPYRYLTRLTGTVPVAGWTLEGGPLVSTGAAVFGGQDLRPFVGTHPSGAVVSRPQWGSGTLAPWLPQVTNLSASAGLTVLWAPVSMPAFTDTWTIDFAYAATTSSPGLAIDVNPSYLGGSLGWPQLTLDPANSQVSGSFGGLPEVTNDVSAFNLFDGLVHHLRWKATQVGADVTWEVGLDETHVFFQGINSGTVTATLPAISTIALVSEAGTTGSAVGYPAVWTTPVAPGYYTDALFGHRGEDALERLQRLADEEDLTVKLFGDTSTVMGPQPPKAFVDLAQECEDADQGILYDGLDIDNNADFVYVARSHLYNQAPSLAIAADALDADFRPIWDNQQTLNDFTSSRPGGDAAHYADEAHVAAVGVRLKGSGNINVLADDQLIHDAGWRVAKGTAPGPRYDAIRMNLRNTAAAAYATAIVNDLNVGGRLTVAAGVLPDQHPPGGLDVIVMGWEETIDIDRWEIGFRAVPAETYDIAVWGTDSAASRWGARNTALAEDLTETETAADVTAGETWVTTASHPSRFPLNVDIGGLTYACTAITGTAPNYTLTLTRLAVDKTHATGAPVTVADAGRYGH